MRNTISPKSSFLIITICGLFGAHVAYSQAQPPTCEAVFQLLWADRQAHPDQYLTPDIFQTAIIHTLSPATSPACGAMYLSGKNVRKGALDLYKPARRNLFAALQNYSAQQQQGSTNSSAAITSPVSKVTGLSGIAEEFSGTSVSSGTSALTFQFSPGPLLTNLVDQDVIIPCSPVLQIKTNCVAGSLRSAMERLTLSATANTSTAAQSIKGTATSSAPGSTAAPATLNTAGTTEPSFGGFGVKFVALYLGAAGKQKAPDTTSFDQHLSQSSALFFNQLVSCGTFVDAMTQTAHSMAISNNVSSFIQSLQSHYGYLGEAFIPCLDGNTAADAAVQNYLAAYVIEVATNDDVNAAKTTMLGFEYDLNTPPNQPAYSSMKSNFSWTFGESVASKSVPNVSCSTPRTGTDHAACAALKTPKRSIDNPSTGKSQSSASSDAKAGASANTKPWTINAFVSADLYNEKPSSSIPSASHLRDVTAGVEIDYIVKSSKIPKVGSLIGDSTLAGTYYYQDQTSPSILKGPPSSITIANLPSTASQVYTTRGPINLGQLRYGLGTGSNVSFPICFTYANRSELVTNPIKGLQFGLSYNLSSLFSTKSK